MAWLVSDGSCAAAGPGVVVTRQVLTHEDPIPPLRTEGVLHWLAGAVAGGARQRRILLWLLGDRDVLLKLRALHKRVPDGRPVVWG